MRDIVFEKAKGVYAEFGRIHKKTPAPESLFFDKVKLCRSAASLKTRL